MDDDQLPEADMLYLAGGYPELYAEKLSANVAMRNQIASYCRNGGFTYAECGGMMYLSKAIILKDGSVYSMCGVLDLDTSIQDSKLTLGYRKVFLDSMPSMELSGHEFHYSQISRQGELQNIAQVKNERGEDVATPVYKTGNTIASYIHLYWPQYLFSHLSTSCS
jgi:cobyrinic acid a,c-diamide synthase